MFIYTQRTWSRKCTECGWKRLIKNNCNWVCQIIIIFFLLNFKIIYRRALELCFISFSSLLVILCVSKSHSDSFSEFSSKTVLFIFLNSFFSIHWINPHIKKLSKHEPSLACGWVWPTETPNIVVLLAKQK